MTTLNSEPLFSLENLCCSYNGTDTILEIKSLKLERGKTTAVLGVSGAGKSTILETLGLMNKTFNNGSDIIFHTGDGEKVSYSELWERKNIKKLEAIRNRHFSFIFQETNLMPNFTAYENVCLGQMFQGTDLKSAFEKAKETMNRLGLDEVDHRKKPTELSGGQKQRLAFIRAVTPEYTVLFGDEPTGNLDEKTSEDLMNIIRDDVQKKNVSAIIVTHNIRLAVKFADVIVIITKSGDKGELLPENIFYRTDDSLENNIWLGHKKNEVINIEAKIKDLL